MRVTLAENFRAVFYAPIYAFKALDFASQEGLEIEWLAPRATGMVFDEIKRAEADLTWGGPMRVVKDHDNQPDNPSSLVSFGEIVARDPFFLVGKLDAASFDLRQLQGTRISVVSEVPTPWLCLRADLLDARRDGPGVLDSLNVQADMTMPQQLQALREGAVDVCQLFEPYVSEALSCGAGQVLYSAHERGPTVYTTFICSREGVVRHRDAFTALTRALGKLQKWLAECDPQHLTEMVSPFFPDVPESLLRSSIARYVRAGVWAGQPEVSREGFDRLADSLYRGRFITSPARYESCVHNFECFTTPSHPWVGT